MKIRANLAAHIAFGLCGLGGYVGSSTAHAEIGAPIAAASSAVNPPAAPQYQDRYIGGGSLVPDITAGDEGANDPNGFAHSLELGGVCSVLSSRGSRSAANA